MEGVEQVFPLSEGTGLPQCRKDDLHAASDVVADTESSVWGERSFRRGGEEEALPPTTAGVLPAGRDEGGQRQSALSGSDLDPTVASSSSTKIIGGTVTVNNDAGLSLTPPLAYFPQPARGTTGDPRGSPKNRRPLGAPAIVAESHWELWHQQISFPAPMVVGAQGLAAHFSSRMSRFLISLVAKTMNVGILLMDYKKTHLYENIF